MIPEYRLYHGAVLAELVHSLPKAVEIDELSEEGRLTSYVLSGRIGLHIKHSAKRLHPWQFTFSRYNLEELAALRERCERIFIAFVCHTDGVLCIPLEEVADMFGAEAVSQVWFRVSRRRGHWYSITRSGCDDVTKRPKGVEAIVALLLAS